MANASAASPTTQAAVWFKTSREGWGHSFIGRMGRVAHACNFSTEEAKELKTKNQNSKKQNKTKTSKSFSSTWRDRGYIVYKEKIQRTTERRHPQYF